MAATTGGKPADIFHSVRTIRESSAAGSLPLPLHVNISLKPVIDIFVHVFVARLFLALSFYFGVCKLRSEGLQINSTHTAK